MSAYPWLHCCPYLTSGRWTEECRLVEERFSLFSSFVEMPFLGFRGVVSRGGTLYRVMVAAEIDMYPTLRPSVYVSPPLPGGRDSGKVCIDEPWLPETSRFAPIIGEVVKKIEAAQGAASDGE